MRGLRRRCRNRPRFPAAFRLPAFASWAILRPLGNPALLAVGLPAGWPAGPQRGCCVAHEQDATGQGASLIPGAVVRSRAATTLRPAPAALPRPAPTAPLQRPTCEGHLHETSSEVHSRSPITPRRPDAAAGPGSSSFPPVFSSPALPGWNGQRFGFYPGLRTPKLPAAHARAETGQRALARVLRLRPKPTSSSASHLNPCTITPHVVRSRLHRHHLHPGRRQLRRELPDRRHRRRSGSSRRS